MDEVGIQSMTRESDKGIFTHRSSRERLSELVEQREGLFCAHHPLIERESERERESEGSLYMYKNRERKNGRWVIRRKWVCIKTVQLSTERERERERTEIERQEARRDMTDSILNRTGREGNGCVSKLCDSTQKEREREREQRKRDGKEGEI